MSYIPVYKRPPNTFVRYEERRFDYGWGSGTERVALFKDRNGKPQEMIAQVVWDSQPVIKVPA